MSRPFLALLLFAAFTVACSDGPGPTDPTGTEAMLNAGGSTTECTGLLPAGVYDNVAVPPSTVLCIMIGITVLGNVKAFEDSRVVIGGSTIRGNVDGDRAELVQMVGNTVGGSIQIKEGDLPNDFGVDVLLCNNILTAGSIQVERMRGSIIIGDPAPPVATLCVPNQITKGNLVVQENVIVANPFVPTMGLVIRGNQVAQNIQVFKNIGAALKFVQLNTAGEAIQCTENQSPFVGTPNTAPTREEQCAP